MSKFSERFRSRFQGLPDVEIPDFMPDETPYEARLRQYRDHMAYLQKAYETMPPMIFTVIGGQRVVVS